MIAKAIVRFVRMSPQKVRYVIDLVRGLNVKKAQAILEHLDKEAAIPVKKVLNSAISNATNKTSVLEHELYISKITADGGPAMHRFRAATMGRAGAIKKRTSHVTVELDKMEQIESKNLKVKNKKADNKKRG